MRRSSLAPYALLAGLAACGKVPTFADGSPDSVVYDADTTPDVAVPGMVTVTVLDPNNNGAPLANTPVVFLNADGTLVASVKSNGQGVASATMVAGGSVTAVTPRGTATQIMTSLDVAPGDEITLGIPSRDSASLGNFTVNEIPAPFSGYTATVYHACGRVQVPAGATSVTFPVYTYCKDVSTDLLIVQTDPSGTYGYSLLKPNVHYRGNATEGVTGFNYEYMPQLGVSITGMPLDLTSAQITRQTFRDGGFTQDGTPAVGGATATTQMLAPRSSEAWVSSSFSRSTQTESAILQRIEKVAGAAHSYGIDIGTMLPWMSGVTVDLATNKVTWTQDTAGGGDIVAVAFSYKRGTANNTWIVFGPPSLASVTLPSLPADLGGVNPTASDVLNGAQIYRLRLANAPGYAAVRENPLATFNQSLDSGSDGAVDVSSAGTGAN